jgi:hypothetical protein
MEDPNKRQVQVIADLQKKIHLLEQENKSLKFLVENRREPYHPRKHIKVRIRKNGEQHQQWGAIGEVVRKSRHLTCREIVNLTGFERCAVYSAARRLGVTLKSAKQRG